MKKLHIDRLNKIVKHLKHGKLGHKEFDFSEIHTEFNETEKGKKENKRFCGSAGCAVGEFPTIFPRHFRFYNRMLSFKKECTYDVESCVMEFLKIYRHEYYHLFSPNYQLSKFGGKHLAYRATKEQVADNILAFIKYKQRNEK